MKSVSVFCGSSLGTDKIFEEQAFQLGAALAKQKIELVYGGASIGLMGAVANGVLENGGKAFGVIPSFLNKREIGHKNLTELIVVETMHERKLKMSEMCDGVIALPGGFGTMEELFEMLTWAQLQIVKKPIGILNTNGFYNDLIGLITNMNAKNFLSDANQALLLVDENIEGLLEQMHNFSPNS
ncbi:MAG: TIGR00730 family Rossman fold protein [Flavobacteriales bacterium]|nr:TIGR00730 family Rossman fold protein [Flavobacteriales bacterium]